MKVAISETVFHGEREHHHFARRERDEWLLEVMASVLAGLVALFCSPSTSSQNQYDMCIKRSSRL